MSSWKPALLRLKPFDKSFNRSIPVESRTGSGRYMVNLHTYTCTCPDFIQRRSKQPVGELGRSCKHLRDTVLSLDTDAFGDELTRVIFKSPHGPYDRIWFAPGPDGEILAVGLNDEKPWINIFVRSGLKEPYSRYGYHPIERRWSYDSPPAQADVIVEMLTTLPGGSSPA